MSHILVFYARTGCEGYMGFLCYLCSYVWPFFEEKQQDTNGLHIG